MVLAMQRGPVVVPSSPAVPQQQHGPNALQMSEPSSFNISLTLHQSYQVSPRFRLDKISQGCGKGGGGGWWGGSVPAAGRSFAALWNRRRPVEAARSLRDLITRKQNLVEAD